MTRFSIAIALALTVIALSACASVAVVCEHTKIYPGYEVHRCGVEIDKVTL